MLTYFLALYPHVLARLRKEILEVVGHTQRPDQSHIRELKYLRAVINGKALLGSTCPADAD